jgi:hypothetical protein
MPHEKTTRSRLVALYHEVRGNEQVLRDTLGVSRQRVNQLVKAAVKAGELDPADVRGYRLERRALRSIDTVMRTGKTCSVCGKRYIPAGRKHGKDNFCSMECWRKHYAAAAKPYSLLTGEWKQCPVCGKRIFVSMRRVRTRLSTAENRGRVQLNTTHFACSQKCGFKMRSMLYRAGLYGDAYAKNGRKANKAQGGQDGSRRLSRQAGGTGQAPRTPGDTGQDNR